MEFELPFGIRSIPRPVREQGERGNPPELGELVTRLRHDPAEAVHDVLLDRQLYLATTLWYRQDRRSLFGALASTPILAQRVIGYGLYLLGGAEGDPLPAWEPFGVWVLTTREGFDQLLNHLNLTARERARVEELNQRYFPWARRYAILAYLQGISRYRELRELLHLAAVRGNFFMRVRARGALRRGGEGRGW